MGWLEAEGLRANARILLRAVPTAERNGFGALADDLKHAAEVLMEKSRKVDGPTPNFNND